MDGFVFLPEGMNGFKKMTYKMLQIRELVGILTFMSRRNFMLSSA